MSDDSEALSARVPVRSPSLWLAKPSNERARPDRNAVASADTAAGWRVLAGTAGVTAAVLLLTAGNQISDTNFYFLSEAMALLNGDRPSQDFYEWGAPLAAYVSAGAQWLVGRRLIGEFLVQWTFIVLGIVLATHVGISLSRSRGATMAMIGLALIVLGNTPTYHYSKLFFFPLAISLAWRYMDRPTGGRSVALAAATVVAFLFRHDYGLYFGWVSAIAFAFAHRPPAGTPLARRAQHVGVWLLATAALLAPFGMVVHAREGLLEYTRTRAAMYEAPRDGVAYAALLELNPLRHLAPEAPRPPKPARVGFLWKPDVTPVQQLELEQQYGLRRLNQQDDRGRPLYQLKNVYDDRLFGLDPFITDGAGFEWEHLDAVRNHRPTRDDAEVWLGQVCLLVPVVLALSGGRSLWRARRSGHAAQPEARRMLTAGLFLVVVDSALFRQPSYMVTVAPVTAALAAAFFAGSSSVVRRAVAVALLVPTLFAAIVWARPAVWLDTAVSTSALPDAFRQLVATPPIEGISSPVFRYLHDCTAAGDRVLVAGSTPYQVSYYVGRPIAGGHLFWRDSWRADAEGQRRSLELLQDQSVPFAFSTHDPVMDEFGAYPLIRDYLADHYAEAEGFYGRLLVDTRRQPTGRFGATGLPCFQGSQVTRP